MESLCRRCQHAHWFPEATPPDRASLLLCQAPEPPFPVGLGTEPNGWWPLIVLICNEFDAIRRRF